MIKMFALSPDSSSDIFKSSKLDKTLSKQDQDQTVSVRLCVTAPHGGSVCPSVLILYLFHLNCCSAVIDTVVLKLPSALVSEFLLK